MIRLENSSFRKQGVILGWFSAALCRPSLRRVGIDGCPAAALSVE